MSVAANAIVVGAMLAAASPLVAQDQRPVAQPRAVVAPGYGTVYVAPEGPKDTRTSRQRCVDEEVAREGGAPSRLAMRVIDLKCSQS